MPNKGITRSQIFVKPGTPISSAPTGIGTVVDGVTFVGDTAFAITKPIAVGQMTFILVGAGGGGGAGQLAASGNARTGGGGGASGNVSIFQVPAAKLPSTFYCRLGLGGAGGNPNDGVTGTCSYLSVENSFPSTGVGGAQFGKWLFGSSPGGSGGQRGAAGGAGGAGTGVISSPYINIPMLEQFGGTASLLAGITGLAGGAAAVGTSFDLSANQTGWCFLATPGAGGGGVTAGDAPQNGGGFTNGLTGANTGLTIAAAPGGAYADMSASAGASNITTGTEASAVLYSVGGKGQGGLNGAATFVGQVGGPGSGGGGGAGAVSGGVGGAGGSGYLIILY